VRSRWGYRHRVLNALRQCCTVAQEEEEQVQHEPQLEEEGECALADIDCARGNELARFARRS
jgi:hypothetical protein